MADSPAELFDSDAYLRTRFSSDVARSIRMWAPLRGFHKAFESLTGSSLKILDYGCGPVIQNSISAAAHASEIVFCDIAESNLEAVRKWLKNDPAAFDWTPHFDYVVQLLEGKGEKEAREREAKLRAVAKGPVHCDIYGEPPIEKGYEGPYDVVIDDGCLQAACTTSESFKESVAKLASLAKSGGTLMLFGTDISMEIPTVVTTIGNKEFNCLCITKEFIAETLREAGYSEVQTYFWPTDVSDTSHYIKVKHGIGEKPKVNGIYFITAKKTIQQE